MIETTTIRIDKATRARMDPHLEFFTVDAFVRSMVNRWEASSLEEQDDAMTKTSRDRIAERQAQRETRNQPSAPAT